MTDQRTWRPDVLDGFQQTTLTMPDADDGRVEITLVRRETALTGGLAVLYVHGFGDYFFQAHLAAFFEEQGIRFYAVDLRRHGRSMRPHQWPDYTYDIAEYVADIDAAVDVLTAEEGVTWLVVNGHSTGGLAAVIHAARGERKRVVDALFLSSPFLDMNLPQIQEVLLEPVIAFVGGFMPQLKIGALSSLYGDSIHISQKGEWDFDLDWKPLSGFPARAGWVRAIHRAQGEVERGLHLQQPVLLLHSSRSLRPKEWVDDIHRADIVLDVADMRRLGPGLGTNVEVTEVPDAIHDLVLSRLETRLRTFELVADWLSRVRPDA
jgi:alpha-beta hydrolase superfamily lysophospholipase